MSLPTTLVLPVSGQGLWNQTGIVLELIKHFQYKPKTILGASGGAIVASMAISCDWSEPSWLNLLDNIVSGGPVKKYPFGVLQSFFEPSLYRRSLSFYDLIDHITSPNVIPKYRNTELVIATYDQVHEHTVLLSTATIPAQNSRVKMIGVHDEVISISENLGTNLKNALLCTSSAQLIFSPVKTSFPTVKSTFVDGGVSFSSPLSPYLIIHPELTDVLYITPLNIDSKFDTVPGKFLTNTNNYLNSVSLADYHQDRGYYLLRISNLNLDTLTVSEGDASTLSQALETSAGFPRLVELFVPVSSYPSLSTSQTRASTQAQIATARNTFRYRIYSARV